MRKLWKENPYLSHGKIREYDGEKGLMDMPDLLDYVEEHGELPLPVEPEAVGIEGDLRRSLEAMTHRNFREFAKIMSSKVYDLEVEETRDAIRRNEVGKIANKYKDWSSDLALFPD